MKQRPPKRRKIGTGIPLTETENCRFWDYISRLKYADTIESFLSKTGLYLRGRCDGPDRSETEPCGYVFISIDSFIKNHASLLFFDPEPKDNPLNISFRKWKGVLPFSEVKWNELDGVDRAQSKMRIIELTSNEKLENAISLAKEAKKNFEEHFDISIDL